jgi:hypothetical protein
MRDFMEWVFPSILLLLITVISTVSATVGVAVVWFLYTLSKMFKQDDPYTFGNDEDP